MKVRDAVFVYETNGVLKLKMKMKINNRIWQTYNYNYNLNFNICDGGDSVTLLLSFAKCT